MLFLCYPRCSTCAKARAWLQQNGIGFTERDIKTQHPTLAELRRWHAQSGLPLTRFFNTSGLAYRAAGLKDRLPGLPQEQQLALLAADGMLVRRPLLVGDGFVLVGFREAQWRQTLLA